jgi:hypothetical protein
MLASATLPVLAANDTELQNGGNVLQIALSDSSEFGDGWSLALHSSHHSPSDEMGPAPQKDPESSLHPMSPSAVETHRGS